MSIRWLTLPAALIFWTGIAGVQAAETAITGYGSARFGMTVAEVEQRLPEDSVRLVTRHTTDTGERLLDGHRPDNDTDLRYVFPDGERLALIVEFIPELERLASLEADLTRRYGDSWDQDLADWWFERLSAGMPPGVEKLMVWGRDGEARNRVVRLWVHEDYLSVEYLDLRLFETLSGG